MQAVAVARACVLVALALFLAGDLASLLYRLTSSSSSAAALHQETSKYTSATTQLGHHTNAIPQRDRLAKLTSAVKNSCLPKLICELNASQEKDKLNHKAKSLLQLIRDTSISMTAEVSSRYHFAAHMGQLISGIDGTGCHNFYPGCPLPSVKVLSLLNKPSLF
uniref:Putative salivary secreted peptide n=1 Tax=Panstrongylus lignarius TaxID=156445 RepID=A0A224XYP5_9HEMI